MNHTKMKYRRLLTFLTGIIIATSLFAQQAESTLNLCGMWRFQLDPMGFGKTPGSELYLDKLSETIMLPGSTDQGGKGIKNNARYVDRLSRKFEYQGAAWYQREIVIPNHWSGKEIYLSLERCHWETTVYVDGKLAGMEENLGTPNTFLVTSFLTPGVHTLTLCIDNRLKYPMDQWNHGTTEYTQTNWNGVAGRMVLQAKEKAHLRQVNVYPDVARRQIEVTIQPTSLPTGKSGTLNLSVREKGGKVIATKSLTADSLQVRSGIRQILSMGNQVKYWDEFSPNLYELEAVWSVDGKQDTQTVTYGMRSVEQGKHHIRVNGRDVHLRGVLDCAVFPLTGYPSTEVNDWRRIFTTIKNYGMNHVRFHSWCPPEAAFIAGDELGMYLQAELPMWIKDVGQYPARRDFFEKEMIAILDAYGNHPSFILMCNGNENEGNFAVLEDLVKKAQAYDPRRLYSASTARTHTPSDEYYVSHVTDKGWITVYEGKPSTDWDLNKESDIDVPVVAHETGQRCMYPNFEEIKKYTGVVEARNFEVFRERLTRNGMLHQADDFFRATGAHTVLQYKEVNEALLRTNKSGGFQLLGLADFPGQGSAFVGILDAFWESKGLVSPEKFRESCAPTVLLARLPKRTFRAGEKLNVKLEIYHYGQKTIKAGKLNWTLVDAQGATYRKGSLNTRSILPANVDSLGIIELTLNEIDTARKLTFKTELAGIKNEWDVWVYPTPSAEPTKNIVCARAWNEETRQLLKEGKNVLLIPEKCEGRKAHFASHFWNPIMFNWNPMIVGTLIQNQHPVFHDFPTEKYADWQWWDILNNSTALDLNELRNITPLIQSIDSYETNRKLGIAFEANVSNGKLFILCADIEKNITNRIAMQQLLTSVCNYVASEHFQPKEALQLYEVDALFPALAKKEEKTQTSDAIKLLLNK